MKLQVHDLSPLAVRLAAERKRQGLSRTQAAAVCNVSTSFIRDAESTPERCSLGKLLLLVQGLGLTMEVAGWAEGGRLEGATSQGHAVPGPPPEDSP